MKLSLDWLSDFVSFSETDPSVIAERLTLGCAEVEEVEVQGALLENCVMGRVLTIEKHPNADKLKLCDVETNRGRKRVVCGGTNLREGMFVAFAHIGARVKWHGGEIMELQKTKIRGEESEGMICAAEELDLVTQFPGATERMIIDLETRQKPFAFDRKVGSSLREVLGLTDIVFHIDNHSITHRADLFSHIGFARECVALGLGQWKKFRTKPPRFTRERIPFDFKVSASALMPRYFSCLIHIDGLGETPEWMVRRLVATGWRPLNLPIDITNYVAMEVGVPLHSFDADDIVGTVHMREAKRGERIVTLDRKEHELSEGALVLSDDEGIFDLLGIMGGLRSSTKETTQRIYLHSAVLHPPSIRRTMQETGQRTDAGTVYEKGVPPITAENGFYRAVELFLKHVPGARVASRMDTHGRNGRPKPIQLSLSRASSYFGRTIGSGEAKRSLTALDFAVKQKSVRSGHLKKKENNQLLLVTPPLHRLGDIHEEADLFEEIARVSGFSSFPEELPVASIAPPMRNIRLGRMRDFLREEGFFEIVQFAFLGEELLGNAKISSQNFPLEEVANPFGEDMRYMRPSLYPRLLDYAAQNIKHAESKLLLFEVGHVFGSGKERQVLSLLLSQRNVSHLKEEPFLLLKAILLEMCASFGISLRLAAMEDRGEQAHPRRAANLFLLEEKIGTLYQIHPEMAEKYDLPLHTVCASLELDMFLTAKSGERIHREAPAFPSIVYDTTVPVQNGVEVQSLLKKVRSSQALLADIRLTDLYQKGIERYLTFRCTYNAPDRTLTEEETKPVHEKVEEALREGR